MSASVFPARAGMSRRVARKMMSPLRVPRASGDEPLETLGQRTVKMCSPRERG